MKIRLFCSAFAVWLVLGGCAARDQGAPESKPIVNHDQKGQIPLSDSQPAPINARTSPLESDTPEQPVLLDVPLIEQNPELKYGCEVTSLAMVLNYAGIETDKMKLADELPKDTDPLTKTESGDITHWGNPDHGFVGDITGKTAGYAVYAGPLETLMNHYLQNRTMNLSGKTFDDILAHVKKGKPVILWTTGDYKLPDRWESWRHGNEQINTPLDLHAVVLVGFDNDNVYFNDPLSGKKAHKINIHSFLESWNALGQQALSYS
jgi:uncharacterized protein YvpB